MLNEFGGREERKKPGRPCRASIITHSGSGVWGIEARVGRTEPDSSSFSHPIPKLYREDVQFVCVLILKVPSYLKKIILILKNKNGGTSPGGFQGPNVELLFTPLCLRVPLPRTVIASRAGEAGGCTL